MYLSIQNIKTNLWKWCARSSRTSIFAMMKSPKTPMSFTMKTEFFHELFRMLNIIHKKANMKKISNDLPVYIIAGTDDPVSNYGKTVQKLYEIYKSNGIKDLEIKLYENDRHELFNETDCEVVIKDTITWLLKHL